MRVLATLVVAAVLATAASAQVAATSPGEDNPGSFPHWSPDGSRLKFSRGYDYVVLQLAGSRQQRLPREPGVWSPDGKHFAFVRSKKVYVADANGAGPRQIGEGYRFSVVPGQPPARDRRHVALRRRLRWDEPAEDHPADPVHDVSWQVSRGPPVGLLGGTGSCSSMRPITMEFMAPARFASSSPTARASGGLGERSLPSGSHSWSPDGRWLAYSDTPDTYLERTNFFVAQESDGFRGVEWSGTAAVGDLGADEPLRDPRKRGRPLRDAARRRCEAHLEGLVPFVVAERGATGIPLGDSIFLRARAAPTRGSWRGVSIRLFRARDDRLREPRLWKGAGHSRHSSRWPWGSAVGDGLHDQRYATPRRSGPAPRAVRHGSVRERCVHGEAGNDAIDGARGDDVLYGDSGNDLLIGGADVDRLYGGRVDERLRSRDAWRDAVACGSGRDIVEADRVDLVAADCEVVRNTEP